LVSGVSRRSDRDAEPEKVQNLPPRARPVHILFFVPQLVRGGVHDRI
jgi:hypothetical protein